MIMTKVMDEAVGFRWWGWFEGNPLPDNRNFSVEWDEMKARDPSVQQQGWFFTDPTGKVIRPPLNWCIL